METIRRHTPNRTTSKRRGRIRAHNTASRANPALTGFVRYKPAIRRIATLLLISSVALAFGWLFWTALVGYGWIHFGNPDNGWFIRGFWGHGGLHLGQHETLVAKTLLVLSGAAFALAAALGLLCTLIPWLAKEWFTW